ncbi:unnamed protein product, partial [Ceratitis capitata]
SKNNAPTSNVTQNYNNNEAKRAATRKLSLAKTGISHSQTIDEVILNATLNDETSEAAFADY